MSIWDDIWDNTFGRIFGDSDEKDKQRKMINDQVRAYQEQAELTRQELARKRDEEKAEKRRIEEKQVRALRRNYRGQGFLGSNSDDQPGMNDKLGG